MRKSSISDPKIIGPGVWGTMHLLAKKNTSREGQEFVKRVIEDIIISFPCMDCRGHAMEYLSKNPIEVDGYEFSVFIWTVDFHNFVNKRLYKDYIDVQDALKIWSGENVCLEDCGEGSVEIDVQELRRELRRDTNPYKVF
jgi:hypothetical protein